MRGRKERRSTGMKLWFFLPFDLLYTVLVDMYTALQALRTDYSKLVVPNDEYKWLHVVPSA